ncbi:MAG: hypothetical protein WDM76_13540 [Limisphaerales bacterium]
MNLKFALLLFFVALSASAQTNVAKVASNSPSQTIPDTNQSSIVIVRGAACEADSRDLRARPSFDLRGKFSKCCLMDWWWKAVIRILCVRRWIVPGWCRARPRPAARPVLLKATNRVRFALGWFFITDIPKARRTKPAQYDYVILQGYPAGQYTYTSLGTIERTVRRFSAGLSTAVDLCLEAENKMRVPTAEIK